MFLIEKITDKVAVKDDAGNTQTYRQLDEYSKEIKQLIGSENVVLVVCDNSISTIALYYALMDSDNIPLLLDLRNSVEFINDYMELYRPTYIWDERHELIKTAYDRYEVNPNLAIIMTTSGSTGNPKTVRLSKRNIYENTDAAVDALHLSENDRHILTLSMSYSYGLLIINFSLRSGATLFTTEKKVFSSEFGSLLKNEKITVLHGVPYIYEMMDRIGIIDTLPRTVEIITMGGGRAREALHNKLNKIVVANEMKLYALYGQTEGTCILTKLHDDNTLNEPGCIGVPCLGMKAYISEDGELVFEGSSVSLGYAFCWKDLRKPDENKGVLYTGDLAEMDEFGQIYLLGRSKRFLKLLGNRVNLEDIEKYVENEYNVSCVCAGSDEGIIIYLIKGEIRIPLTKLKMNVNRRFRISISLITIIEMDEFPRNFQGKIDYKKL